MVTFFTLDNLIAKEMGISVLVAVDPLWTVLLWEQEKGWTSIFLELENSRKSLKKKRSRLSNLAEYRS